jgi:hypothetical protein
MGGYELGGNGPYFNGIPMIGGGIQKDFSGSCWFVDANSGSDGNSGKSWAKAWKTLPYAVTANNADIARGADRWARRNTIFIAGDNFGSHVSGAVSLVAFPNKCDVIGCGSTDGFSMATIAGLQAPVNADNWATRFFNIRFLPVEAGALVTLANTSSGIQFQGCLFDATGTNHTATRGILATASPYLKVNNCVFQGAFATTFITFGDGQAAGTEITNNIMMGSAGDGIVAPAGTTSSYRSIINRNVIQAATVTINDTSNTSGLFYVTNNTLITAAASAFATSIIVNLARSANNMVTGNDHTSLHPVDTNSAA